MIKKLVDNFSPKSYKIFNELIFKNKKDFLILILLLLFQIFVLSLSVISIVPLADYLVDETMSNPNKISKFVIRKYGLRGLM